MTLQRFLPPDRMLVLGAALILGGLACSNAVEVNHHGTTSGAGGAQAATTGANGSPAATSTGSGGAGGHYEPPPNSQTLSFGPLDVPGNTERTQCVIQRLGNVDKMYVHRMHNELVGVSHHMIIYRVTDTVEQTTPFDCQPFANTLSGTDGPLMISQKHSDSLELPANTAFVLDPNQMIRLEVHYINPQMTPQTIEAHATFEAMAPADFQNEAGFLFAGTPAVSLPPNQMSTAHAFIPMPSDLTGKSFFGFTGHVHKLGTNVRVGVGTDPSSLMPVYDVPGFTWSEPPTIYHDPPIVLQSGEGFDITCDYENTTSSYVGFGESANDEMCFFWAYYFPNVGPKVIF